jgi:hypothetical protein
VLHFQTLLRPMRAIYCGTQSAAEEFNGSVRDFGIKFSHRLREKEACMTVGDWISIVGTVACVVGFGIQKLWFRYSRTLD